MLKNELTTYLEKKREFLHIQLISTQALKTQVKAKASGQYEETQD
jgi:hypothetical protein